MMEEKNNFQVNGYIFSSLQDKEEADEECKKAEYFSEKTRGRQARSLLAAYDMILDQRIFKTPVGWEYLRQIQERLKQDGIPEEQIRPIPMYINFSYRASMEQLGSAMIRQQIEQPVEKKIRKESFYASVGMNILLVLLVIVMFVITLKSDNPNILNYEKVIVNKYASWEQELTERENKVREKEKELQMDSYAEQERGE